MPYLWEKIDRGRYAAHLDGHLLEVIRNPEFPEDNRRYQPCVDHTPIDTPKFHLKVAQTTAVEWVERLKQTASKPAQERQEHRRLAEAVMALEAEYEPVPEPVAEEMLRLPPPAEEPRTVTFTVTGTVTTTDHIHAMQEIRAAVDMLRSVAETRCRIIPPGFIDL